MKGLLPYKVLIEIIILNPFYYLQDYFKSRTTGIPTSQKLGTSTEDDSLPVLTSNGDSPTPPPLLPPHAEAQLADTEMINIRMTVNGAYQANEPGSNN